MARDPMDTLLAELATWTETRTPRVDTEDAELLLGLLHDHVGVEVPSDLGPGDVEELLLEVYPRKVTVLRQEDAADVIPTVRELLAFLGDTGRVPAKVIKALQREVDQAEPRFLDAVMDPAKWGMARTLAQAMVTDGVDLSDPEATQRWIEQYNANLPDNPFDDLDLLEPDDDDELIDLKDAFGLPDRLPPLRLPPEDELAATARGVRLLDRAKQLALWVGERRRVTEDGDLTAADAVDAARALGIEVPERLTAPDTPTPADLPELAWLWLLAVQLEFVEFDGMFATLGPGADDWPDGDDDEVLDIWQTALADTLARAIVLDDSDTEDGLEFAGIGAAIAVMLFLAGGEGIPLVELNEVIKQSASDTADKTWQRWVKAHGEPADVLLARLANLGAAEVRDGVAVLTPLSRYAVRLQLVDSGVEVPLVPPVEEMTAADLVAATTAATEDELEAEGAAWLALRDADTAVDELLAVASAGEPPERIVAVSLAARAGAQTQERWQRALDDPTLRPYAKITLAQLAGAEPHEAPPEVSLTPAELAWLLTDTLAGMADALTPDELAQQLSAAVPAGQEQQIFEQMWRLDHPYAHEVLTLLGKHHPDNKIAKSARKAAFKVAQRN